MISFKTSPVAQRLKSEDSYRLTRPHPDSFSLSVTHSTNQSNSGWDNFSNLAKKSTHVTSEWLRALEGAWIIYVFVNIPWNAKKLVFPYESANFFLFFQKVKGHSLLWVGYT